MGANLIGCPLKPLELLDDGMLPDITDARESYFVDDAYQYENLGKYSNFEFSFV